MSIRNDEAHELAQLDRRARERLDSDVEPTSSVAVALADKAAARARRELERQQDWQCFIRQESARIFASMCGAERGRDVDGQWAASTSVRLAQCLWDALPEECKL